MLGSPWSRVPNLPRTWIERQHKSWVVGAVRGLLGLRRSQEGSLMPATQPGVTVPGDLLALYKATAGLPSLSALLVQAMRLELERVGVEPPPPPPPGRTTAATAARWAAKKKNGRAKKSSRAT